MITWCLCFLEICSAIPTTLHFQCVCILYLYLSAENAACCAYFMSEKDKFAYHIIDILRNLVFFMVYLLWTVFMTTAHLAKGVSNALLCAMYDVVNFTRLQISEVHNQWSH